MPFQKGHTLKAKTLVIGGQCSKGHQISVESDLTKDGRCRACKRAQQAARDTKRQAEAVKLAYEENKSEVNMLETSAQRKARVAEARVENTEISEQFGFDVTSVLTRPLAREPWRKFKYALKFSKERPNCEGREAEFSDFLWEDRPTPEQAQEMCKGCPMFKLCEDYAAAQQITWTVMGGKVHGEEETE